MLSYEMFVAKRYLRSKRRTAFISTITYISFFGIAIGVAVLIIVLSVFNGFENEVKTRFISNDAHLRVRAFGDRPFSTDSLLIEKLSNASKFVKPNDKNYQLKFSPYIESYGMLKGEYADGGLVRGVDSKSVFDVLPIQKQIIAGTFNLEGYPDDYSGIVIGKGLADRLGVIVGEEIRIISPAINSTLSQPPVRIFRLTGCFETGLAEIDGSVCYISLESAQKLFRMIDQNNGIYIKLTNEQDSELFQDYLNKELKYPLNALSWKDLHKNLYAWMKIEKLMMGTVLSLIIIIAAFNILSGLIMVVMEKKKDIGIMMALGATKSSITKIFIYQGMLIGVVGTIMGAILGYLVCYLQLHFKFISLPSDVYFIDAMPILMRGTDFVAVILISLLLTFLSTIYPSRQAAKMLPADTIRND